MKTLICCGYFFAFHSVACFCFKCQRGSLKKPTRCLLNRRRRLSTNMALMGSILTGNIRLMSHLKALRQVMGPKNGSPSPSARMRKVRKLAGRESYNPVARLYQSDDLRHGPMARSISTPIGMTQTPCLPPLSVKSAWGRHYLPSLMKIRTPWRSKRTRLKSASWPAQCSGNRPPMTITS